MHTINNVFDKVYVVNLEHDKDKRNSMQSKLNQLNIEFEFYKAVDGSKLENCKLLRFGNKGAIGCKCSHMEIFKQAKLEGLSKILILEDDLFFLKDFNNHFNNSYEQLLTVDKEWQVLYFGGTNQQRKDFRQCNSIIQKLGRSRLHSTLGIAHDCKVYDTILKSEHDNRPIDDIIAEDVNDHNYMVFPFLAYQNINKASNTVDTNNRDQQWYNDLNQVDASQYF